MRATEGQRLHELDSLRGLAALSVVACHCLKVRSGVGFGWLLWLLDHTPLGIVRASHEAVIFFFVLSGFVLALPFLSGPVRYRAFLAKRVCRIYLPYYAALVSWHSSWRRRWAARGCREWDLGSTLPGPPRSRRSCCCSTRRCFRPFRTRTSIPPSGRWYTRCGCPSCSPSSSCWSGGSRGESLDLQADPFRLGTEAGSRSENSGTSIGTTR